MDEQNLKIVKIGEPVLRQKALAVSNQDIPSLTPLVLRMKQTMYDSCGVGLAAPQVGLSIQLIVIEDKEEYHKSLTKEQLLERERKVVPFMALFNPELSFVSQEQREFYEGCLSVPGIVALVPRAAKVKVKYHDERGKKQEIEASGWLARILQHEIDHLRGILFIDRAKALAPSLSYAAHWGNQPFEDVVKLILSRSV